MLKHTSSRTLSYRLFRFLRKFSNHRTHLFLIWNNRGRLTYFIGNTYFLFYLFVVDYALLSSRDDSPPRYLTGWTFRRRFSFPFFQSACVLSKCTSPLILSYCLFRFLRKFSNHRSHLFLIWNNRGRLTYFIGNTCFVCSLDIQLTCTSDSPFLFFWKDFFGWWNIYP